MLKKEKPIFGVVKGESVNPRDLEKFMQAMDKKIIPKIVEITEERRLLAVEKREKQLKC